MKSTFSSIADLNNYSKLFNEHLKRILDDEDIVIPKIEMIKAESEFRLLMPIFVRFQENPYFREDLDNYIRTFISKFKTRR